MERWESYLHCAICGGTGEHSDVETYLVLIWTVSDRTDEIATWTWEMSYWTRERLDWSKRVSGGIFDVWANVLRRLTWLRGSYLDFWNKRWRLRSFQIWQVRSEQKRASYLECRRRTAQVSSVWAALRWGDPYPVDYQPSCLLSLHKKTRKSNKFVFQEPVRGTKRNKSNQPSGFSIIIQRSGANN